MFIGLLLAIIVKHADRNKYFPGNLVIYYLFICTQSQYAVENHEFFFKSIDYVVWVERREDNDTVILLCLLSNKHCLFNLQPDCL